MVGFIIGHIKVYNKFIGIECIATMYVVEPVLNLGSGHNTNIIKTHTQWHTGSCVVVTQTLIVYFCLIYWKRW